MLEPGRNSFYIRYYGVAENESDWIDFSSHAAMLGGLLKDLIWQFPVSMRVTRNWRKTAGII